MGAEIRAFIAGVVFASSAWSAWHGHTTMRQSAVLAVQMKTISELSHRLLGK